LGSDNLTEHPPRRKLRGGFFPGMHFLDHTSHAPDHGGRKRGIEAFRCAGRIGRLTTCWGCRAAWLGAVLSWSAGTAVAHPKPGAHADVRISIEADAVEVHVVMNLLFADQIVNVTREARDRIGDAQIPAMSAAMTEYFGGGRAGEMTALVDRANQVRIDGIETAPVIGSLRILIPEAERRPGFVQNPALLLPQIHAVVTYPCKSPPQRVSLVWGSYPRDFIAQDRDLAPISDVECVLTSGTNLDLITFRKSEPEFVWHAPTAAAAPVQAEPPRVPRGAATVYPLTLFIIVLWVGWLAVKGRRLSASRAGAWTAGFGVLAAAAAPAWSVPWEAISPPPPVKEGEAVSVFAPLHANVYRAFDYTRESDVFDALARSVDGAMLDRIYNDVYRGLILREEGGALSRVKQVTPLATALLPTTAGGKPGRQFRVRTSWRVEGVVYHWGHSHTRINEYEAEYVVADRPEGWRIVDAVPLSQRRIETEAQAGSEATVGDGSGRPVSESPLENSAAPAWRPNR